MPTFTPYYYAPWEPGGVYHVYNRATHRDRLFVQRSDHFKFREKVLARVAQVMEVFSYALVLNHFHSAVRLPREAPLRARLLDTPKPSKPEAAYLAGELTYNQLFGFYWGNALKSYSQSVNKRRKERSGALYESMVRRIRVRGDLLSRSLVMYHHTNEMHHGIADTFRKQHERTSFGAYLDPSLAHFLTTAPVLERFGGLEAMVAKHEVYVRRFGTDLRAFDERKYFGYGQPLAPKAPFATWLDDAWLAEGPAPASGA